MPTADIGLPLAMSINAGGTNSAGGSGYPIGNSTGYPTGQGGANQRGPVRDRRMDLDHIVMPTEYKQAANWLEGRAESFRNTHDPTDSLNMKQCGIHNAYPETVRSIKYYICNSKEQYIKKRRRF